MQVSTRGRSSLKELSIHTDIYKNSTYEQLFKDRHEDKIAEHRIKIHNDTL